MTDLGRAKLHGVLWVPELSYKTSAAGGPLLQVTSTQLPRPTEEPLPKLPGPERDGQSRPRAWHRASLPPGGPTGISSLAGGRRSYGLSRKQWEKATALQVALGRFQPGSCREIGRAHV